MKRLFSAMVFGLILIVNLGCTGAATPAAPSPPPKTEASGVAKSAWQEQWDKTLAAARKEGKVSIYGTLTGTQRADLTRAFGEKYGIDLEITAGRGELLQGKIEAERRAGLYTGDIFIAGGSSAMLWKKAGLLDPLPPALILPEVLDPKAWLGERIQFIDQDRTTIAFFTHAGSTFIVNTNLVNPEEIKSYKDLLLPKFKGKTVMDDPTISGAGSSFFALCIMEIMGGLNFAQELIKQDPKIISDYRLLVEWVAKGSYLIGIAPQIGMYQEFKAAGAPLKFIVPVEGTYSIAGNGGVTLLNKAAHPNAATVFINWLLSQEGQTVMAKSAGDQSRRLDVSAEYIDEDRRVKPGVKYLEADNEDVIQRQIDRAKLAREIFAPLLR